MTGALAVVADPGAAEVLVPEQVRDAVAARRMWTEHLLQVAPGVSAAGLVETAGTRFLRADKPSKGFCGREALIGLARWSWSPPIPRLNGRSTLAVMT